MKTWDYNKRHNNGMCRIVSLSGVRGTEWALVKDGTPNKAFHLIADKSGSR